jgi:predicted NUDIX family NTP pyrophosphohydrolase
MPDEVKPGRIKSKRVYTGKIISLDVDTVRFPDGSVGELEMIRHPGASAVVPFLSDPHGEDPQVLLIRQYRYAADGYLYEIPAGRLDQGENPRDCAVRELKEETGCAASGDAISLGSVTQKSGKVVHLWASEGDCDATTITSNTFRVEWPRGSGRMHEFPEVDRAGWFSLDEAKEKLIAAQAEFVDRLRQFLSLIPSVPSGRRSR